MGIYRYETFVIGQIFTEQEIEELYNKNFIKYGQVFNNTCCNITYSSENKFCTSCGKSLYTKGVISGEVCPENLLQDLQEFFENFNLEFDYLHNCGDIEKGSPSYFLGKEFTFWEDFEDYSGFYTFDLNYIQNQIDEISHIIKYSLCKEKGCYNLKILRNKEVNLHLMLRYN